MPYDGSPAQGVIEQAQYFLSKIIGAAGTDRMGGGKLITTLNHYHYRKYSIRRYEFIVAVRYGHDGDPTGTIMAQFVFNDEGGRGKNKATITVFMDVVTKQWITNYVISSDSLAVRDAIRIATKLNINFGFTYDIGEQRAISLITALANFIVNPC